MAQRNQTRLEDLYELAEDYVYKPMPTEIRPGLIEAVDKSSGEERLLKFWWKTGKDGDKDLRELWNRERLQVNRVMNYPDATEVLVGISGMLESKDAFCVIHEAGAMPLVGKHRSLPGRHWLNALEIGRNRAILWHNLGRLTKALGIIHAQGLIHGRLDRHAVFTEGSSTPDFKLGGFEWSLGVGDAQSLDPLAANARARIDRLIYSYADDWKALGILFAELLNIEVSRLRDNDPFRAGTRVIEVSDSEIEFLRKLIDPSREDALDARSIGRSIELLIKNLEMGSGDRAARFVLLVRLNDRMREAISEATDGQAPAEAYDDQITYLEADLAAGAKIIVPDKLDISKKVDFILITDTLSYKIKPLQDSGSLNWQIGVVVSILTRDVVRLPNNIEAHALAYPIILTRSRREADSEISRLGSQLADWSSAGLPSELVLEDEDAQSLRLAVLLVQAIEALTKAVDILPVKIVERRQENGRTVVRLTSREGSARDNLAPLLNERKAAEVMERLFEREDTGVDIEWRLSTSGSLSSRAALEVRARFISVDRDEAGIPVYEFEVHDALKGENSLFLRPSGDSGTESLIRRKLRTTKILSAQSDLVSLLLDPRRRMRSTGDVLSEDEEFRLLDKPKQDALKSIWTTTNQFVVGPPGVGKTRLSTELVRRRLETDPTSRMLLSAQSHQALDHLLSAVRKEVVKNNSNAIIVRSRGSDESASTDQDLHRTALSYLSSVVSSKLFSRSPSSIKSGLMSLKEATQRASEEDTYQNQNGNIRNRDLAGIRALEALVLESANIVFSTSNSLDLERLGEDGAQFDWVIIEEAAKATGPELIAALSLSGRRLLIGDHYQLPPFDSERISRILQDRSATKSALEQSEDFIGPTFFESGLEELQNIVKDDKKFEKVISLAFRTFELFKSLVEEDKLRRSVSGGQRRSVTSELLCQHRMDPAIATLISTCFYKGRLDTGDERKIEASKQLRFSMGDNFPTAPIVFIDMPFQGRTGRPEPVENGRPRWHNPSERLVVESLLDNLRPRNLEEASTPITVAVLSPYRAQVERLRPQVQAFKARNGAAFRGFTHDGRFEGTVDSSQGSEADLVIVSLVRNNHRTGVSALGFLRDSRRMNVLLSRAKSQIILVGSLEFLRESVRHAPAGEQGELAFIRLFLETLDNLRNIVSGRGGPSVVMVPLSELSGGLIL